MENKKKKHTLIKIIAIGTAAIILKEQVVLIWNDYNGKAKADVDTNTNRTSVGSYESDSDALRNGRITTDGIGALVAKTYNRFNTTVDKEVKSNSDNKFQVAVTEEELLSVLIVANPEIRDFIKTLTEEEYQYAFGKFNLTPDTVCNNLTKVSRQLWTTFMFNENESGIANLFLYETDRKYFENIENAFLNYNKQLNASKDGKVDSTDLNKTLSAAFADSSNAAWTNVGTGALDIVVTPAMDAYNNKYRNDKNFDRTIVENAIKLNDIVNPKVYAITRILFGDNESYLNELDTAKSKTLEKSK